MQALSFLRQQIFLAWSSNNSILNSKNLVGYALLNLKPKCIALSVCDVISSNLALTYIDLPLTSSHFFISDKLIMPNIEYNFPLIKAFLAESKLQHVTNICCVLLSVTSVIKCF